MSPLSKTRGLVFNYDFFNSVFKLIIDMGVTGNQSTIEAFNPNPSSVKSKRNYRVLIGLLRGVPLSLGIKARRSIYRKFFGKLGNFVHIETDVEFIRPYLMEIGEAVQIRASAYLEDCWLGTGVRVLDGATIGQGSVIGAGAVVTKDIPPFSVAVGVPAKVLYQRNGISENSEFMVHG